MDLGVFETIRRSALQILYRDTNVLAIERNEEEVALPFEIVSLRRRGTGLSGLNVC